MPGQRLMLHFHPGTNDTDRVIAAVFDASDSTTLLRSGPGLSNPGEHVASVEYTMSNLDDTLGRAGAVVEALGTMIDRSKSVVLVGTDVDFIDCEPTPVRYSYFMRRRPDFTHAAYLARYHDVHSKFGFETPGIEGYTQFHVDLEKSAAAATFLDLSVCDIDSVSELHLESLDKLMAGLAEIGFDNGALEDEEKFVDRPNSWDYLYRVIGDDE